ncbi:MAG TPA: 50S ribosomal protein L30 [Terriglobia bacterium]|nr:50S ribosomal protein L30 [Terriglobia bacterium]
MPKKTGTIHIKWIRSGIGFSRKQKEVVRSIGLHRLNQVVERPDSAHFRGLVAKVCHLVAVVEPPAASVWTQIPEYKIIPAESKVAAPPAKKPAKKAPVEEPVAAEVKAAAPAKKAVAAKGRAAKPSPKETAKGAEKAKPKRKAAAPKPAAAAKKESKSKKGKK